MVCDFWFGVSKGWKESVKYWNEFLGSRLVRGIIILKVVRL